MRDLTADARFTSLDNKRSTRKSRLEHYSGLTLPYLMPPEAHQDGEYELRTDHHSIGAQAVNHLANKVVIGLFQPGFPFFKLELAEKETQALAQSGVTPDIIEQSLSIGERNATKQLAKGQIRPQLFEAVKQLIVLGNALPVFHKQDFELINFRDYVIKRSRDGSVLEMVVRNCTTFGELESEAREELAKTGAYNDPETKVTHYYWILRNSSGKYNVTQWIDKTKLSSSFDSTYSSYSALPWQPQAWVLPAGWDYGVGLVEEYVGDLTAITEYAESLSDGAAIASVWRFLVDPSSQVRPEDITEGENGDALPGTQSAISILQAEVGNNMSTVQVIQQDVIQRFSRGFLLMSSVTRDAERVTAQEIRTLANELETGLGGVYSRLAVSFQSPLAYYLLRNAKVDIQGTKIEPVILTGFDALSRAAELERVQLFLQDVANITSLPPQIQDWLKIGPILRSLAANRHLTADDYVNNQEQVQQAQQQRQLALQDQQTQEGNPNV